MRLFSLLVLASLLTMAIHNRLNAQIKYDGSLSSSLYSWQASDNTSNLDYYQGVQFKIAPIPGHKLYFKTYLRFARIGQTASWDNRIYNGYLDWKAAKARYHLRLGRQFTYYGVIRGSLDALFFVFRPASRIKVLVVAGTTVPYSRKAEIQNPSDNNAVGLYGSYAFSAFRTQVSYFQKAKNGQKIWQQMGVSLNGTMAGSFYYTADAEIDLLHSTYQRLRFRADYYVNKWIIHGEISAQKPRLYEDFLYQIFEIEGFSQIRTGVSYSFGKYRANFDYLLSVYGSNLSNKVIAGISSGWGYLGLLLHLEDNGRNMGVVGNITYPLNSKWSFIFHSSYYNYKRHLISVNEDAAAFSAGVDYKPFQMLSIGGRIQGMVNSYYKHDFRGLFSLKYFFHSNKKQQS